MTRQEYEAKRADLVAQKEAIWDDPDPRLNSASITTPDGSGFFERYSAAIDAIRDLDQSYYSTR